MESRSHPAPIKCARALRALIALSGLVGPPPTHPPPLGVGAAFKLRPFVLVLL